MRLRVETLLPDLAKGVRAAVATIVPFYFALAGGGGFARPELGWIALGGWLGSLADPGGSRGARARVLALFAVLGGAAVALGETAAPHTLASVVLLAALAFASSLLRALGAGAGTFGTLLLILATIALSAVRGVPLHDGAAFAAGAAWATLLSSVVWPVWTHLPLRRAVAAVFAALAAQADAIDACAAELPPGDARWGDTARREQRAVRAAIEEALVVAVALRSRRAGESRLGANLRLLLGDAEAEFFALIALSEEIETDGEAGRTAAATTLSLLALRYRTVHDRLFQRRIVPIGAPVEPVPGASSALRTRLHAASFAALALAANLDAGAPNLLPQSPTSPRKNDRRAHSRLGAALAQYLAALRDALSPRSPYFRHALRMVVTAAAAIVVARRVSPTHVSWVTVTAVAVLQPFPGATTRRAAERVLGTVLGSIVAALLMTLVRAPLSLALIMFPLSVAAVVTRPRSYRLFAFFITPVFVLVADHGQGGWWTAAVRAGDSAIGGALGLAAAVMLFPAWEERRLGDALADVLAAVAAYAATMFDVLERGRSAQREPTAVLRRNVGLAIGEAETSLERLLAEPRRSGVSAERALQAITYTRRLASALTTLDLQLGESPPAAPVTDDLSALRAYVDAVLSAAALSLSGGTVRAPTTPELPRLRPALERILHHAELVAAITRAA